MALTIDIIERHSISNKVFHEILSKKQGDAVSAVYFIKGGI